MNPDQKHKQNIRRHDRNWKSDKFPSAWGSQFEIHHRWNEGGRIQLLTPAEHEVYTRAGL